MAIKSRINDAPFVSFAALIDIVFLLLIFFVLQPFKEPENKLGIELPQDMCCDSDRVPPKPIDVQIFANRRIPDAALFRVYRGCEAVAAIHGGPRACGQLARLLANLSGGNAETPVLIQPQDAVHFEHVSDDSHRCLPSSQVAKNAFRRRGLGRSGASPRRELNRRAAPNETI